MSVFWYFFYYQRPSQKYSTIDSSSGVSDDYSGWDTDFDESDSYYPQEDYSRNGRTLPNPHLPKQGQQQEKEQQKASQPPRQQHQLPKTLPKPKPSQHQKQNQQQQQTNNQTPLQNKNSVPYWEYNDNPAGSSTNQNIYGDVSNSNSAETEDPKPKNQNQNYQHLKSVRRHKEEAGVYATLAETF